MITTESEFQKLYHSFYPAILRYLTRLVGPEEAEGLTQEVFIKISQGLKTFRGESQLSTWMYRIATNVALDRMRSPSFGRRVRDRSSNESVSAAETDAEEKGAWMGDKTPLVEHELIRQEMHECLRRFIENLPADYRMVVVLSELEGLKNREIATILGLTLETIKIRLHRARATLKKALEAHCSLYRDERGELACDLKSAREGFRKVT